ncbi:MULTISPECIES: HD-GYP domain-containing protein [unclassified Selenomonas]|uniref:HD-GYP domain-containing protein n=1 Tax=unclassified Selenomonas TaxID=2637378 RepID=UPI00056C1280|nr:HDIG domain-containing protein [Selenomonas ruminantium]
MIRLPIKKLKPGMIIAQSIYNRRGASYLVKGRPLTEEYIARLSKIGLPAVTVTSSDPRFQLPPPEDIVQENTRIHAIETIYNAFQSIEKEGSLDVAAIQSVTDTLVLDIIERRHNLVQLTDIRLHDTYTFAHSVNVAILSAMMGVLKGYNQKDLQLLTMGAMLHDVGKIDTPNDLLNKPGRLTDVEYDTIKQHPGNGALRIMEMQDKLPDASTLASIAAEHHEHIDGKGYPRGLRGGQINRYAKVVAVADVYDALTSVRPYKKAYPPNVAHNIMVRLNRGQFDPEVLDIFFNNVALYPVGTILQTVYGFAIVSEVQFGRTSTPTIIVFATLEGKLMKKPLTINLSNTEEKNDAIQLVILDNELRHFLHELNFDPTYYLMNQGS